MGVLPNTCLSAENIYIQISGGGLIYSAQQSSQTSHFLHNFHTAVKTLCAVLTDLVKH